MRLKVHTKESVAQDNKMRRGHKQPVVLRQPKCDTVGFGEIVQTVRKRVNKIDMFNKYDL